MNLTIAKYRPAAHRPFFKASITEAASRIQIILREALSQIPTKVGKFFTLQKNSPLQIYL